MRAQDRKSLEKALAVLRDPGGNGRTKMSHGFTGQPMVCGRCKRPTIQQAPGIKVPDGPRCGC
jgi:hypothetical protein